MPKKKSSKSDSTNINTIQSNPIPWLDSKYSTPQLVVIICKVVLLLLHEMIFKTVLQSTGGLDT